MSFIERYQAGEYEQVWSELQNLGASVRDEPNFSQAKEVAAETMRRVRRNCECIISRLQALGYVFGTFPDGTLRDYEVEPLTPPSSIMQADFDELELEAGPLPLSLTAFWHQVGSIDLVGMHPLWPDGLDPLVVYPPEGALDLLYDEGDRIFVGLAPDDFHKDNTSGGDPYGLELPGPTADFTLMFERHNMLFVPYLRFAILGWGGFPGLEGREIKFEPREGLIKDLELF